MYLTDLSAELNVTIEALKDLLASKNIDVSDKTKLTNTEVNIIRENFYIIGESKELVEHSTPKIDTQKRIEKIDLNAIDIATRPKNVINTNQEIENTPLIFSAAKEFNIKSEQLIELLESKGFKKYNLTNEDRLTQEMYEVIKDHFKRENELQYKSDGPDNSTDNEFLLEKQEIDHLSSLSPRLMAAAKEFNISKDTLIDYLLTKGFNKNDLKPSAKLKHEMYLALLDRFQSDKLRKLQKERISLPESKFEEPSRWKAIIDSEQKNGQIKIHFIKTERTYKNGRPIVTEKPDLNRWIFAFKEYWGDYKFIPGKKIIFSIAQIDRDGKKINVAMPPKRNIQNIIKNKEIDDVEDINNDFEIRLSDEINEQSTIEMNSTSIKNKMNTNISPLQKILFGSPGTGKSYQIVDADNSYFRQLIIEGQKPDLIKTVFHPEYTYGDFMGKLMPLTNRGKVEYRYYSGHFMLALGIAYKNIIKAYIGYNDKIEDIEKDFKSEKKKNKSDYSEEDKLELHRRISAVEKPSSKNVLLVIDEINRGNSAAIFGTVFQLLDRDNQGWSSYPVKISDLELKELLNVTGLYDVQEGKVEEVGTRFCGEVISRTKYDNYLKAIFGELDDDKTISLIDNNIKIPPNLSIIATMNTSDNSIYFMDSAFKRRWDWEFIDISSEEQKQKQSGRTLEDGFSWDEFVDNLNEFIKKYGERIRKIEDKQIGYYFIKGNIIKHEAIRNKLMFFLWDSIFNNDKKPLKELIGRDKNLVTFGDFIKYYEEFIEAIKNKSFLNNVL